MNDPEVACLKIQPPNDNGGAVSGTSTCVRGVKPLFRPNATCIEDVVWPCCSLIPRGGVQDKGIFLQQWSGVENHGHSPWFLLMFLLLDLRLQLGDWSVNRLDGDIRDSGSATSGRGLDALDVVKVLRKSVCFVVIFR